MHLLDAQVLLISQQACSSNKVYSTLLDDGMICAGYLKGGVDSCQVGHHFNCIMWFTNIERSWCCCNQNDILKHGSKKKVKYYKGIISLSDVSTLSLSDRVTLVGLSPVRRIKYTISMV